MKKSFLLTISLCIAFFQLYAQQTPSRIEKKNFSDVNEIRFNHSFGNITVTESTSNQVELEIQYFDYDEIKPSCDISFDNKVLKIKTRRPDFQKHENLLPWKSKKMGIDYIIAVPKSVAMDVNLKYGNISMDDYYGNFKCNLAFSNIKVNTLHNSPVSISSEHSNINISTVDVLDLSMSFGRLSINTVQTLTINSKHAKCGIAEAGVINANGLFGSIDIGSIDEFIANLRHTPLIIYYLDKKLNLKGSFVNTKIDASSNDLKEIYFNCSYSNLKLGLAHDLSAKLNIDLEYGNLSVDDKFQVKYSISEKDYKRVIKTGVIGKETPTANIRISNMHAKVNIYASSGKLSMQNTDSIMDRWQADANAERMRENAERVRENAERVRENANRVRENAERVRENAERVRENAERVRKNAERVRENAERVRENAERVRENAERVRNSMRENAERMRENAEHMYEISDTIKIKGNN